MIYIISENKDLTTDLVIEWLLDRNATFVRVNDVDFKNVALSIFNVDIFSNATKIWQRRGKANFLPKELFLKYPNRKCFLDYLSNEESVLMVYVENELKERLKNNYIGSFVSEDANNKLVNLKMAYNSGFHVPKTLVTNQKKDLLRFLEKQKDIITKDLYAPVNIKTKNKWHTSTTVKVVDNLMLGKLKNNFAPIFVQELIEKKYEIRVFIFFNLIYSMAIFSQNDKKTKIDFRNYNNQKPNRNVPVILPNDVKESVKRFMKRAKLNTGSIDLIVTPNNRYYFLEVNPMGQFHWLSENCNFYIEKQIANFLTNEKN